MKFHGFDSVQAFISACRNLNNPYFEPRLVTYRRVRQSDFAVQPELRCLTAVPPGGDPKTDIAGNLPEQLVVLLVGHTRDTAVNSFNIFSPDFSALYADGVKDYYKPLLECWGYEKI